MGKSPIIGFICSVYVLYNMFFKWKEKGEWRIPAYLAGFGGLTASVGRFLEYLYPMNKKSIQLFWGIPICIMLVMFFVSSSYALWKKRNEPDKKKAIIVFFVLEAFLVLFIIISVTLIETGLI